MTTLTSNILFQGSPAKLNSGDWGIRINGRLHSQTIKVGDVLQAKVTTKQGKTWEETGTVIWTDGKGTALLSKTASKSSSNSSSYRDAPSAECKRCRNGEYLVAHHSGRKSCDECGHVRGNRV